ncbi:MAG: NIPSNAP family protein [Geminicoccaceae bacterium]
MSPVIFDHRTYYCRPGTIAAQLALYEEYGIEAQKRHLGEPIFYATTETGDVNSFVHIWAYENAGDRERRRAAMEADPQWQEYKKRSAAAGNLVRQENKIMVPTKFFSIDR